MYTAFNNKQPLSNIFDDTTSVYDYYWFLAILDYLRGRQYATIAFNKLAVSMIARAWHAVQKEDTPLDRMGKMPQYCEQLRVAYNIPLESNYITVVRILSENKKDEMLNGVIDELTRDLPYNFLTKWLPFPSNAVIVLHSQAYENNCLYRINDFVEKSITINPMLKNFIVQQYKNLVKKTYFELGQFLRA